MKKRDVILSALFCLISIISFSFISWEKPITDPEEMGCRTIKEVNIEHVLAPENDLEEYFFYNVNSNFVNKVTRERLLTARTIIDILPPGATKSLESFSNVRITVFKGEEMIIEEGVNENLNQAQLNLIKSLDYSTNFRITADCKNTEAFGSGFESYDLVYYMTTIPEKEAEYQLGHDALIEYLKENSKVQTIIVDRSQLRSGRISFTITKDGGIEDVKLTSSSGYPTIDDHMVGLIKKLSGSWSPATNRKGDNVDQELVFSFGQMGC